MKLALIIIGGLVALVVLAIVAWGFLTAIQEPDEASREDWEP